MGFFNSSGELEKEEKVLHQVRLELIKQMQRSLEKARKLGDKEKRFLDDLDAVHKRMVNLLPALRQGNLSEYDAATVKKNTEMLFKFVIRDIHEHPNQRYFNPEEVEKLQATFMQSILKQEGNVRLAIDMKKFTEDFIQYILRPLSQYIQDLHADLNALPQNLEREMALIRRQQESTQRLA